MRGCNRLRHNIAQTKANDDDDYSIQLALFTHTPTAHHLNSEFLSTNCIFLARIRKAAYTYLTVRTHTQTHARTHTHLVRNSCVLDLLLIGVTTITAYIKMMYHSGMFHLNSLCIVSALDTGVCVCERTIPTPYTLSPILYVIQPNAAPHKMRAWRR